MDHIGEGWNMRKYAKNHSHFRFPVLRTSFSVKIKSGKEWGLR
jgi:hypothetical protein